MGRRQQFYHGGAAELEPGDLVEPWSVHRGISTTGNGTSYAWATTDPVMATTYAKLAKQKRGVTGHVYKVRPIDGDNEIPEAAEHAKGLGRPTGWLVESHAWSTEDHDADREAVRRESERKMWHYQYRRRRRIEAYDRDGRLNPEERAAKEQALNEVSPEHAEKSRQFEKTMSELTELLAPRW